LFVGLEFSALSTESAAACPVTTPTESETLFRDLPLIDSIHQAIDELGFERPTPIQSACIPPALEGKDVIGLAQTGTGKTAAFAIPIIQRLAHRAELGALVLAPTRELAAQITESFEKLGGPSGVRVACVVGGVPMEQDYKALRSWPNVLVATPGRLNDHIETSKLSLAEIEVLVVDEADRMHDMGFIPQIRRIIDRLPQNRQTMMFTATLPADVERIARRNMRDPVRIQIGLTAPAHRARQELYEVSEDDKPHLLVRMLRRIEGRQLIFLRTKRGVDRLSRIINGRGIRAAKIHGDMEQLGRDKSLSDFRDGAVKVLVATDIAARGLDVSGIEHVINYDFPHHAEDYVHRIGRTARADASGLATSFITRADRRFVSAVRQLIGDKLPHPLGPDGQPAAAGHHAASGESRTTHDGARKRRRRGGRRRGRSAAPATAN
jgi:ATP-dependent RNA helicase RhlE